MDKKAAKKLDEFTDKLMQDYRLEEPSFDFTSRVMAEVEQVSETKFTTYEPLISKKIGWVIALLVVCVAVFLTDKDDLFENSWYTSLEVAENYSPIYFSDFEISSVYMYAILGFTLFLGIQILMLKDHFNKRLI